MRRKRKQESIQDPDALQRFVENKTREIAQAVREGLPDEDLEDLEAERDSVVQELSMLGEKYASRAREAIERIEREPNPSAEALKRKLMR